MPIHECFEEAMEEMEKIVAKDKTVASILEEIASEICDHYCKYPSEEGHEDDPDWLYGENSPCNTCPLVCRL